MWHPAAFFNKLVITDRAVAEYTRGAHLNTDDNNRLAYSTPKALLQARSPRLLKDLYRFRSPPADVLSAFKGVENVALIEKELSARTGAEAGFRPGPAGPESRAPKNGHALEKKWEVGMRNAEVDCADARS
jgi:hypothetical protein